MKQIGLVLSGGGAKGAYEVGVWAALQEMGILNKIDGIIGTSVGALNAVLLETCGYKKASELWGNLSGKDILKIGFDKQYQTPAAKDESDAPVQSKTIFNTRSEDDIEYERICSEYSDIEYERICNEYSSNSDSSNYYNRSPNFDYNDRYDSDSSDGNALAPIVILAAIIMGISAVYIHKNGLLSQRGIKELIDEIIDFSKITRDIFVVCTDAKTKKERIIFRLNDYPDSEKTRIILASSAIPKVFHGKKGVIIDGKGFVDAGEVPERNTPIRAMRDCGWKKMIVVWTDPHAPLFTVNDPNIKTIHIIPSKPLGKTLKFDPQKAIEIMKLGYDDTKNQMQAIIEFASKALPNY